MLRMQVSLGAVRARELSVGVLLRDLALGLGRSSSRRRGPAGGAGQNSSPALRADHVSGLVAVGHHGVLRHQRALAVGRVHSRLGHDSTGGHGAEDRWGAAAGRGGGGGDGLGMRCRGGGLRHHARRSARIGLLRVRAVAHDRVRAAAAGVLRRRGRIAGHGARGTRGVGCRRCPRSVGIATVGALLHNRVVWLERRQRVGKGCRSLVLVVMRVEGVLLGEVRGRCRQRGIRGHRCGYSMRRAVRQTFHNPSLRNRKVASTERPSEPKHERALSAAGCRGFGFDGGEVSKDATGRGGACGEVSRQSSPSVQDARDTDSFFSSLSR